MNRHRRFLNIAWRHTFESRHARPMAALIVYGSSVVCYGVNKTKSSPNQILSFNPQRTIHAELDAITKSPFSLRQNATIYVIRRRRNGSIGLAAPCKACLNIIRAAGIKHVVYSVTGCEYGAIDIKQE